jgi:hypothetical protein
MHHQPGRLVQNEQVVVLEENLEGNLFRQRFDLFDGRFCEFDHVAGANGIARPGCLSV